MKTTIYSTASTTIPTLQAIIDDAMIASLIFSAALNVAQYRGFLSAPEQFVLAGNDCDGSSDPIGCVYDRELAGK